MDHDASDDASEWPKGRPKGYARKLEYIDHVINALVTKQLAELEAKLKAAHTQTQALDKQHGNVRRVYACGAVGLE